MKILIKTIKGETFYVEAEPEETVFIKKKKKITQNLR